MNVFRFLLGDEGVICYCTGPEDVFPYSSRLLMEEIYAISEAVLAVQTKTLRGHASGTSASGYAGHHYALAKPTRGHVCLVGFNEMLLWLIECPRGRSFERFRCGCNTA